MSQAVKEHWKKKKWKMVSQLVNGRVTTLFNGLHWVCQIHFFCIRFQLFNRVPLSYIWVVERKFYKDGLLRKTFKYKIKSNRFKLQELQPGWRCLLPCWWPSSYWVCVVIPVVCSLPGPIVSGKVKVSKNI